MKSDYTLLKISVILSVYNGEKYIEKSVKSVLDQSHSNIELIIVNDGSTDGTELIVSSFNDERIKYISRGNKGLTKSLNEAIALSSGDFIARQDADDFSYSERLQKQLKFLVDNDFDVVFAQSFDGASSFPTRYMINQKISSNLLSFGNVLTHGTMLGKSFILKENLYNEAFKYAQDYELWLRLISKGVNLGILFEPVYYLHKNVQSITSKFSSEQELFARKGLVDNCGGDANFISKNGGKLRTFLLKIKKQILRIKEKL